MEEQEGRGLSSPWGKRADRVGEGSAGRCCPNVEDPSKTHSSDSSYRTENQEVRARAERRREEVRQRDKESERRRGLPWMCSRQGRPQVTIRIWVARPPGAQSPLHTTRWEQNSTASYYSHSETVLMVCFHLLLVCLCHN